MLKRRLPIVLCLALAAVMILPATASAFNWSKSPVDPLIRGGVHSKAKFESLLQHSSKVRTAIKLVIKADGFPSWIFNAAVAQAKAGVVHTGILVPGTHIGAMAFGPRVTKVVKHTVWTGSFDLPYFFVVAARTVPGDGFTTTTSYRVALSKTCGNPFVFDSKVTTATTATYNLYIEKRSGSVEGPLLAGWEVTGTVGAASIDTSTSASGPVLVGSYAAGTAYNLAEVPQPDWTIVSPANGDFSGVMPAADLTLTYVNQESIQ